MKRFLILLLAALPLLAQTPIEMKDEASATPQISPPRFEPSRLSTGLLELRIIEGDGDDAELLARFSLTGIEDPGDPDPEPPPEPNPDPTSGFTLHQLVAAGMAIVSALPAVRSHAQQLLLRTCRGYDWRWIQSGRA